MLAVLNAWRSVRPTIIFSVPTVHRAAAMAARVSKETERELFHPGLRFVHTAAAPLPPETAEYYLAHDVNVVVGWGLTETSPCCTLGWTKKGTPAGLVGRPIPGVRVTVDGSGEILVKGPNVMVGYYGDPEATRAVLGKDGVLRTGDLGEFDSYGNLVLRGRADAVVKLSNGEKVPTTLIEAALVGASPLVGHAFVIGGPAKFGGCGGDYVAALLFVPGGPGKGVEEKLRWAIRKVNGDISKDFERVRAFAVLEDLPPFGGDMVTLTGKLARARVIERYGDVIDGIYASCKPGGKGPAKEKRKGEGKGIGKDDDVVAYRPG
jgi:long-subunit acyl-CoA synthetase (AMP-forming)